MATDPVTHRYLVGAEPPLRIEGRFAPELVDGRVRPCIHTATGRLVVADDAPVVDICGRELIPVWRNGELECSTGHDLLLLDAEPEPSMTRTVVNAPVYVLLDHAHALPGGVDALWG